jgi:glycosyltransferase involved in cell wall biosynthesis
VVTQLGAVALIPGAVAHVLQRPEVAYLERLHLREHGLLPWEEFVALQGSVDLNLYVTLSECYPLSPIESYQAGVPALTSRTSSVFRDDPELWDLTTVDELDNPRAIAAAALRLLEAREDAVVRARAWAGRWDAIAMERWQEFVQA